MIIFSLNLPLVAASRHDENKNKRPRLQNAKQERKTVNNEQL